MTSRDHLPDIEEEKQEVVQANRKDIWERIEASWEGCSSYVEEKLALYLDSE